MSLQTLSASSNFYISVEISNYCAPLGLKEISYKSASWPAWIFKRVGHTWAQQELNKSTTHQIIPGGQNLRLPNLICSESPKRKPEAAAPSRAQGEPWFIWTGERKQLFKKFLSFFCQFGAAFRPEANQHLGTHNSLLLFYHTLLYPTLVVDYNKSVLWNG